MIDITKSLKLCLVIGFSDCGVDRMLEIIQAAITGGITSLQLRDKNASEQQLAKVGKQLLKLLPQHIPLIINDHVLIAKYLKTALHIGQQDMEYFRAKKLLGKDAVIGLSIENLEQAKHFQHYSCAYFGIGPVFPTLSKKDAAPPLRVNGLKIIQRLLSPKPCIAIGGITIKNVGLVNKTGVEGVAVISAITQAESPCLATQQLLAQLES